MKHAIAWTLRAKDFDGLDRGVSRRVQAAIERLAEGEGDVRRLTDVNRPCSAFASAIGACSFGMKVRRSSSRGFCRATRPIDRDSHAQACRVIRDRQRPRWPMRRRLACALTRPEVAAGRRHDQPARTPRSRYAALRSA